MPKKIQNGERLIPYNLVVGNAERKLVFLDPDNVFWGITRKQDCESIALSEQKVCSPPDEILSLYKKVRNRLDTQMEDFRFSANLTAIYIDPTDRCNADCPYCYVPAEIRKNGKQMNEEQLKIVLQKITRYFKRRASLRLAPSRKNIKPVIIFHASEPLLVKDIIFKAISDFGKQFYFGLQTNALLLERADVEFLKKHRVGVGISLDSYDPQVNNKQRLSREGDGNFAQAVQAIEWFDGYKGLNVIATITKFNVGHLPELVKFLHSKRVSCVLLNPLRLTAKSARKLQPEQDIMTRYFIEAVEKAMELSRSSDHRIIIGNFANTILAIVAPTARRLMCDISPCGGGRCFLTITASGEMIPCGEFIGLDGSSGGNIFKSTIHKAMQSKPFKKIRARIVEKIDECKICEFRNICGAPCPAELHSLGNMYQPSVFCEFYKEIIKYAFKLIAEDKAKYLIREEALKNLEYDYNLSI
ncbi:MAG: peptide-modifying radical SAM enzyme CbpB [bacterium]|nr:peptide-modifying radical SAM enzyme CbpB [bacterium]